MYKIISVVEGKPVDIGSKFTETGHVNPFYGRGLEVHHVDKRLAKRKGTVIGCEGPKNDMKVIVELEGAEEPGVWGIQYSRIQWHKIIEK